MPKHLKKISEEIIHENPWWQYKHDKYEMPNGQAGEYYYGETSGMVIVVPILDDERIILTLQYRYLEQRESIEFPGGGIGSEADVLESARQELLEETGCIADEFIKVGTFQSSSGLLRDKSHVFLAYIQECGVQQTDDSEEIEIMYRRPEEIDEMIRRNDIWDGQTMAAWALVHHNFLHKD